MKLEISSMADISASHETIERLSRCSQILAHLKVLEAVEPQFSGATGVVEIVEYPQDYLLEYGAEDPAFDEYLNSDDFPAREVADALIYLGGQPLDLAFEAKEFELFIRRLWEELNPPLRALGI